MVKGHAGTVWADGDVLYLEKFAQSYLFFKILMLRFVHFTVI